MGRSVGTSGEIMKQNRLHDNDHCKANEKEKYIKKDTARSTRHPTSTRTFEESSWEPRCWFFFSEYLGQSAKCKH